MLYALLFPPFLLTGWDSEIDIQMTVHLVRSQRSTMVRTEVRVMRNLCCVLIGSINV